MRELGGLLALIVGLAWAGQCAAQDRPILDQAQLRSTMDAMRRHHLGLGPDDPLPPPEVPRASAILMDAAEASLDRGELALARAQAEVSIRGLAPHPVFEPLRTRAAAVRQATAQVRGAAPSPTELLAPVFASAEQIVARELSAEDDYEALSELAYWLSQHDAQLDNQQRTRLRDLRTEVDRESCRRPLPLGGLFASVHNPTPMDDASYLRHLDRREDERRRSCLRRFGPRITARPLTVRPSVELGAP